MDVYIDKANLLSLLHSCNSDSVRYQECMKVLRTNMVLKCNFTADELLNSGDKDFEEIRNFIYKNYVSGTGHAGTIQFKGQFPALPRPLTNDVIADFNDFDLLSAVYLLDNAREISCLKHSGVILCGSPGEETDILEELLFDQDRQLTSIDSPRRLENWGKLYDNDIISPCTDIVIADRYILQNKESYEKNLYPLIKTLAGRAYRFRLKIVILVAMSDEENEAGRQRKIANLEENVLKNIRQVVRDTTDVDPYVTIVIADDVKAFPEHDRTVFTNYKLYISGDSFSNYFGKGENNVRTKGRYISYASLARSVNYKSGQSFINSMNEFLLTSPDSYTIIGDERSGYLSFL